MSSLMLLGLPFVNFSQFRRKWAQPAALREEELELMFRKCEESDDDDINDDGGDFNNRNNSDDIVATIIQNLTSFLFCCC